MRGACSVDNYTAPLLQVNQSDVHECVTQSKGHDFVLLVSSFYVLRSCFLLEGMSAFFNKYIDDVKKYLYEIF